MKRHEKTWLAFLEHMTIVGHLLTDESLRSLAEALSLAAPQGPQGFPCKDGCCMPDQEMLLSLTTAVIEACASSIELGDIKGFTQQVYMAVKCDLHNETAQKYVAQWPDTFAAQLALWRVMVSPQSTAVIQARTIFPNTWAVIEEITK